MPKPNVKAKRLGDALRRARQDANMGLREAAEAMQWDHNRLYRMEKGQGPYKPLDVSALLGLFRVSGSRHQGLVTLAETVNQPGWWELLSVSAKAGTLIEHESDAQRITHWAPLLIPGLLQTMDYSRAWMRFDGLDDRDIELRLTIRVRRQQILKETVQYTAYLGESALRIPVGGPSVLARQLDALLEAGSRSNVSIRVVPMTVGPHRGQLGGFAVLEFVAYNPVVHVEQLRSAVFMDEEDLTDPYLEAVTQLGSVALGETESIRVIEQIKHDVEGTPG